LPLPSTTKIPPGTAPESGGGGQRSGPTGGGGPIAALTIQIVRATYGDDFVRRDVRGATRRAMARAFSDSAVTGGRGGSGTHVFDFAAPEHAAEKLYGDPLPGRIKTLHLEVRCVADGEYAVTQMFVLTEFKGAWCNSPFPQVPHRHVQSHLAEFTRVTVEEVDGGDGGEEKSASSSYALSPPSSSSPQQPKTTLIPTPASAALRATRVPWIDGHPVSVCGAKDRAENARVKIRGRYASATKQVDVLDLKLPCVLDCVEWPDPDPNMPKELQLELACDGGDGGGDVGGGGDGGGDARKNLPERLVLPEYAFRLRTPLLLHANSTLGVVVRGGLANQIYAVACAALIAHKTRRKLAFPFRLVSRKTCADPCLSDQKPRFDLDVPYSALLDEAHFVRHTPVKLYLESSARCDEGSGCICRAPAHRESKEEEKEADARYGNLPHVERLPDNIVRAYFSPATHVTCMFPFANVAPASRSDFELCMQVVTSMRANPRIMGWARAFAATLPRDVLCVHCRIEDDWKAIGFNVITPAALAQEIHDRPTLIDDDDDDASAGTLSVTGGTEGGGDRAVSGTGSEGGGGDVNHGGGGGGGAKTKGSRLSRPPPPIYFMGNTEGNPEFWSELQRLLPDRTFLTKERFVSQLGVTLGFDEGGALDREIALACPDFLGLSNSSLSAVIALERYMQKRPWGLYRCVGELYEGVNNPAFFFENGRPMF
jgi:hypothetical protein